MTPDEHTIKEFFLDVGDGHELYVQDWGNPKAKHPIIFLHGGPGAGVHDSHKGLFDPTQQRAIFFDQRGAGKSLPKGSLEHNTTADLVEDIEKLAKSLKLKQFVITGGSWGSCLALAYGIKYPKRVKAMVLRGIYTGSKAETDFIDNGGFKAFFPDVWDAYLSRTPKKHHKDPSAYHYKQMKSSNPDVVKASAYAYGELEGALLRLDERHVAEDFDGYDPDSYRIEMHYLGNDCFMPDRYIFKNASKLTMPVWLVQGRYDAICPPVTAYELNKVLPKGQLTWTIAGHRGSDRSTHDVMRSLLLQITSEK